MSRKPADPVAMRATVISELQRLSRRGHAPTQERYDAQRGDGPGIIWAVRHLGVSYDALVAEAGLQPAQRQRQSNRRRVTREESGAWPAGSLAADINRHEPASWNDRYSNTLSVVAEPTRIEVLDGHTLDGRACRITREYRMVR